MKDITKDIPKCKYCKTALVPVHATKNYSHKKRKSPKDYIIFRCPKCYKYFKAFREELEK